MRNGEALLRWQGAQLALILNIPAYTAVAYRFIDPNITTIELEVIVAGGIIFAFANLFFSRILDRDNQYVTMWNDFLAELERANRIEGDLQFFSSTRYEYLRTARGRLQHRLLVTVRGCIVIWVLISLTALALIFRAELTGGLTWLIQWLNT